LLPFQKGMLISINSLRNLYQDMKQEFNVEYLLTKSFNQDIAENSFCMIRYFGRAAENPNAYQAKNRLKTLMLGWNQRESTTFMPTQWENSNEPLTFLSTMLLNPRRSSSESQENVPDAEVCMEELTEEELGDWNATEELTSENFPGFFQQLGRSEKSQFCAFEYICGFISKKLASKFPELNLGTTSEVRRNPATWTQVRSSGGLTLPSYNWINWARKLEIEFRKYHDVGKCKVNQAPGAIKGLAKMLTRKYPEVPAEALKFFVRVRTYMRIKHVNKKIEKSRSKKGRQFAACSYSLRSRN